MGDAEDEQQPAQTTPPDRTERNALRGRSAVSGLEIDFETRSDVNIKTAGAYLYFASPHTKALMASYKINGGPKKRWRYGQPCPPDIRAHVEAGGIVSAHNNSFERLLWQKVLTPRNGWPKLDLKQCRCTAATAAAMSLPRDLDGLGQALDLPVKKNKDGAALIRFFSMPRKAKKDEPPGIYWHEPEDYPEKFEQFHDYCDDDVEAESGADERMVPLSDYEQDLYWIDQLINDRGIRIDVKSARAALYIADRAKVILDREMKIATGGIVTACSQVAKIVEWINAQGVQIPSAAKAEIEELLETDDLPPNVRRVLELRQEAAKNSVSKLKAFLNRCGTDQRIRGAFLFLAAGTGRWSSVGAQLHNLPRPRKIFGDTHPNLETLFSIIRHGDPDWLRINYGDDLGKPLHLISDALRSFIWAAPGHELVVADYSGIEGAVAAWFAGEQWKVDAMFELMRDPSLPDLYRRSAAGIFNVPVEQLGKKDPRRQVGKVSELSLQYQGGVGAFRSMARNYSLKIEPVYEPVWEAAPDDRRAAAEKRYEECLKRGEAPTKQLSRKAWLAAELVKVGWRETHPAIKGAWKLLEQGIRDAIESPGRQVTVLKCTYLVARGFLWCRLPSGRCLAYGKPRLKQQVWAKRKNLTTGEWGDAEIIAADTAEHLVRAGLAKIESKAKPAATALGVDSVTKQFTRFALYGGLAFENIVQAIARDLLANGIKLAEANGYPVIGHVHDEIISELPRGVGDIEFFQELICRLPDCYAGLPLSSSGFISKRYKKD
ncbi:DNA polymerase [Bradyrhizobium liaoningense]|uniref:DNA polymerase n=1 Tax=Bradyrhizobium liaoningense TaxID=43992 RepID=UPI0012FE1DBD|nr:DNA polymerase [Bradyrhizobium liaoningense]